MAILKDIKVAIVVNGQELREYDDEDAGDDDQNSVSKYVVATSGAEFQIATSAPMWYEFASDAVVMTIYVDGVCVEQGLFRKEKVGWSGAWNRSFAGPSRFDGDGWKLKPFKFIDIKAVENDSQRTENTFRSSHIKDLGTLNIEIHRQEVLGKSENTGSAADKTLGGASAFTEKQLKGKSVTHGIAFGDARKTDDVTTYDTIYVDGEDSPIAKFTFKYCSRKALQDLLLIPRTPSPPREPTLLPLEERNIDDLTPEETRELLRRHQAGYRMEQATIKNDTVVKHEDIKGECGIKRERDEEYDELMRSAVTKKVKTRAFEHGETIELD